MDGARDHVAHQPAVTLAHLARLDALAHERDQRLLRELLGQLEALGDHDVPG